MLKIKKLLSTPPNQITAVRFALIPVLWTLAILKMPFYLGIGTFISFATDVLDGFVARRLGQASEIGSKIDSLADHLLLPSALIWLWLFVPEVYTENAWVCGFAITLYFAAMFVGWIKFRRFANLHLDETKAAAVAMYTFASYTLLLQQYSHLLFYLAVIMFILSSVERMAVLLLFSNVDEHMGSILLAWRRRNRN